MQHPSPCWYILFACMEMVLQLVCINVNPLNIEAPKVVLRQNTHHCSFFSNYTTRSDSTDLFLLFISIQDVLYTVCNPIGSVLRIVIFKRNGIQAMVEYPYSMRAENVCLNVCTCWYLWCGNVHCSVLNSPAPGLSQFSVHRRPKLL